MCGIIGIAGKKNFNNAFNALKALEYRGYDSFWFGGLLEDNIKFVKKVGAISESNIIDFDIFNNASTIIGHTRWATHGKVIADNSHPHSDSNNTIAIVHNGVISNFSSLKASNPQWKIISETDTEVAANVIADSLSKSKGNITKALEMSIELLEGEFAICGIIKGHVDTLFAIKRKSPLIVAFHDQSFLISSDKSALAEFSDKMDIAFLEDDSLVVFQDWLITTEILKDNNWDKINLAFNTEDLRTNKSKLGDYPHYMIKEISESPEAIINIEKQLNTHTDQIIDEIIQSDVSMTGSGSSYYVTMIGQYYFRSLSNCYIPSHPSDEYLNLKPIIRRDLIIWISQSGETFDTLEVFREAQKKRASTFAINNVLGSSMQRISDFSIYQNSGKEVCVLSTKSIISQTSALYLISAKLGLKTGILDHNEYLSKISDYKKLPNIITTIIKDYSKDIKQVAVKNCKIKHWFFIGRGAHYPVALESALKFKEVSYLHAEWMPAGFFKHGTISLIDKDFYTVVFLPSQVNNNELFQQTIDNIYEIRARGGKVIGFGNELPENLKSDLFFEYISLPDINAELNIIIQLVVGQIFAYHCAVALNRNIDKPRALAKSVTVR